MNDINTGKSQIWNMNNPNVNILAHWTSIYIGSANSHYQILRIFRTPKQIGSAYEVIIGRNKNKLEILEKVGGATKATVQVPDAIKPNIFKPFWITWANETIRVGLGSAIGFQEKVQWKIQNPHKITAISMDTWTASNIQWQFLRDAGWLLDKNHKAWGPR